MESKIIENSYFLELSTFPIGVCAEKRLASTRGGGTHDEVALKRWGGLLRKPGRFAAPASGRKVTNAFGAEV